MKSIRTRCILLFVVLIRLEKGEAFALPGRTDLTTCGTFQTRPSGHCHAHVPLAMGVVTSKKNSKTNEKYFSRRLNIDGLELEHVSQGLRNMPVGNWEPYIIGGIVAFTAARSTLMKRAKKEDEVNQIKALRTEKKQEMPPNHFNIGSGDNGEEELNFSTPDLKSIAASFSTVLASIIIPFFDLDAAIIVAECSPVKNLQMVRTLPSIKQIDMIDDAFDIEEFLMESETADNLDGNSPTRFGPANFGNVVFMTSSVVVTVLGTSLAKVRKTIHDEDWMS